MIASLPTFAATSQLKDAALFGDNSQFKEFLEKWGVTKDKPPTEPGTIAQRIVAVVFSFLGIVAVIVMIYAGFLWMTAGGEEEKAKQGRTLLFQAFIGSLIVLASYSVTYFVLYMLTLSVSP
ncbi:hypothetical protein HY623_03305 [Candidatus Uhrbacteria bacterium]|nr:hypothetical protein [Candidatus Uhrbacteria bacterium]